jgi:hypothetical protein
MEGQSNSILYILPNAICKRKEKGKEKRLHGNSREKLHNSTGQFRHTSELT